MAGDAAEAIARLEAAVERAKAALAVQRSRNEELVSELEAAEQRNAEERADIGQRVEALAEGLEELLADESA